MPCVCGVHLDGAQVTCFKKLTGVLSLQKQNVVHEWLFLIFRGAYMKAVSFCYLVHSVGQPVVR